MAATNDLDVSRAAWRKSTHSNNGGECIEVACSMSDAIAIRDSKNPDGPKLRFSPQAWKAFTATMQTARTKL
jgi:hypothetical protein